MPIWMRHQDAAAYLGVSVWTLAHMRVRGDGPAFYRLGPRLIAYRKEDIETWLQSRRCSTMRDPMPGPVPPASLERTLPELEETAV